MTYILFPSEGMVTGRALCAALGVSGGDNISIRTDILVRWGHTGALCHMPGRVINKLHAVRSASNKQAALQTFAAAGVLAPALVAQPLLWHKSNGSFAGALVGRSARHTRGNGFYLCHNNLEVRRAITAGATHFMRYVPIHREYRIHAARGAAFRTQVKVGSADADSIRRNHAHGWRLMGTSMDEVPSGAIELGVRAINALGLDFGAADVCKADDGLFYCFEVNTAPSLDEHGIPAYAEMVRRLLNV